MKFLRWIPICALLLAITWPGGVVAQSPSPNAYRYIPTGFVQITSMSTATGLTCPGGADTAVIEATSTAIVFWRDDGTAPSASVGMQLNPTPATGAQPTMVYQGNLSAIQFISATGGINVSCYKTTKILN